MIGELIAGIGLQRGCDAEAIISVIEIAMAAIGRRPISVLATPAFKRQEAGLVRAAQMLRLELLYIDERAIAAAQPRCVTRSSVTERAVGHSSIAEGSALAASGPNGRLLLPRIIGRGATCAIAERM